MDYFNGSWVASSFTKTGTGTLTLSGSNRYSGQTLISAGTLIAASSSALDQGGHNGATMSFIADGATLSLQGGISLDEHFQVWGSGLGYQGQISQVTINGGSLVSQGIQHIWRSGQPGLPAVRVR